MKMDVRFLFILHIGQLNTDDYVECNESIQRQMFLLLSKLNEKQPAKGDKRDKIV